MEKTDAIIMRYDIARRGSKNMFESSSLDLGDGTQLFDAVSA